MFTSLTSSLNPAHSIGVKSLVALVNHLNKRFPVKLQSLIWNVEISRLIYCIVPREADGYPKECHQLQQTPGRLGIARPRSRVTTLHRRVSSLYNPLKSVSKRFDVLQVVKQLVRGARVSSSSDQNVRFPRVSSACRTNRRLRTAN